MVELPDGFACGHATDADGWTGVTVLLAPPGSVGAGEVRGGGPGTRESDLLSPWTSTPGPEAMVLAGGSAGGLAAADGVADWLRAQGRGFQTPGGRIPLVCGAVVYDLGVGSADARPDATMGTAACAAAGPVVERGCVGAGTGCSAGKLGAATKSGLGAARMTAGGVTAVAVAAANPLGDILDADGTVLAGAWDAAAGRWVRSVELLLAGAAPPLRTNTTLVCVCTDARLTKLEAGLASRAASAGVARAVSPVATAFDGDLTAVLASGAVACDPGVVAVLCAEVAAAAVRDAARSATSAPGCPSAAARAAATVGSGP